MNTNTSAYGTPTPDEPEGRPRLWKVLRKAEKRIARRQVQWDTENSIIHFHSGNAIISTFASSNTVMLMPSLLNYIVAHHQCCTFYT